MLYSGFEFNGNLMVSKKLLLECTTEASPETVVWGLFFSDGPAKFTLVPL